MTYLNGAHHFLLLPKKVFKPSPLPKCTSLANGLSSHMYIPAQDTKADFDPQHFYHGLILPLRLTIKLLCSSLYALIDLSPLNDL